MAMSKGLSEGFYEKERQVTYFFHGSPVFIFRMPFSKRSFRQLLHSSEFQHFHSRSALALYLRYDPEFGQGLILTIISGFSKIL